MRRHKIWCSYDSVASVSAPLSVPIFHGRAFLCGLLVMSSQSPVATVVPLLVRQAASLSPALLSAAAALRWKGASMLDWAICGLVLCRADI